jgi:hypothetical protein
VHTAAGYGDLGESVTVGQVDDGLAGIAVSGDHPRGQPGGNPAACVLVSAGGTPDRDRYPRVAG